MPETHDGNEEFRFYIQFSEDKCISYKTMRNHVLDTNGGRVVNANRVDGRNDLTMAATRWATRKASNKVNTAAESRMDSK